MLLSETTRNLVGDEHAVRDLGEHRLKDLSRPIRLYQLVEDGLAETFPPLRTLESRPTNLPVQPTQLIGRERELAAVTDLLRREHVRLLTLTGAAGSGKTRLALQAAAEVVEDYADGVFFVPLEAVGDPALVVAAIAKTLGVSQTTAAPLAEALEEFVRRPDDAPGARQLRAPRRGGVAAPATRGRGAARTAPRDEPGGVTRFRGARVRRASTVASGPRATSGARRACPE